ncbi:uncharacterized protein LOC110450588 isoform X2 [Mizuhopecten yessoensis]|uniref:uncharacterized protein LOC110450588 isoform X2 n=1 Tax=Mizuhopecten yessoensis TaxID=6573 RepID=UPI000B4577DA|nr:uncharacterized protein LOC110450588 isoform X2 [Mizuhopecten yessoensis]
MMLQLYRSPSLWSVLALCAYALNLLFHVIAYCSDQWATCTFKGRHTWFGLWQGCWTDDVTKETMCSNSVFQHPFFNTDTDWHKGAQVLMTISLIVLLFTEVVLIGYACVVKLESHKPRMIGMLVGLSISEGAFTLVSLELYRNEAQICITGIVILMIGTEVVMLENGKLSWGYWIKCAGLFLSLVTLILVYKDKYHFFGSRTDLVTHSEKASDKNDFDNLAFTDRGSDEFSGSVITSSIRLSSSGGLGTLDRVSSRSLSCSDIVTGTSNVNYAQDLCRTASSRGRFGGSADNVARTSHVMNFKDSRQANTFSTGLGGSCDRIIDISRVNYLQEPTRRTSADSLTARTGSVNMNPNQSDEITAQRQQRDGNKSRNHRLSSSSSIESDV